MVILDPYGITFDNMGVFGLAFHLLFRSLSIYCGPQQFEKNCCRWFQQISQFFCNQILAGFWYLAQLCVCCCHGAAVDGFDLELAEHRGTEPDLDKDNILKRSAQCQESKIGAFWAFKYSCGGLQNSSYLCFPSSNVLHNCISSPKRLQFWTFDL